MIRIGATHEDGGLPAWATGLNNIKAGCGRERVGSRLALLVFDVFGGDHGDRIGGSLVGVGTPVGLTTMAGRSMEGEALCCAQLGIARSGIATGKRRLSRNAPSNASAARTRI